MTKRHEAKYKISRRLGVNLWGREKDPFNFKNYYPGQHGASGKQRMASDFGVQLAAKQKLKGYYGNISEKQFRAIYHEAVRRKGDSAQWLIGLLEQRLDAVIYRMNFCPTVFSARQLVGHKHITVNGKVVNIPSYQIQPGDVIEVREKSKQMNLIVESTTNPEREVPAYLEVNLKEMKGTFTRIPAIDEVPYPVVMQPHFVIEYYSR